MELQLKDHVILITGGTDGLGFATARHLVDEGAHVIVCGRNLDRLARASDELSKAGTRVLGVQADVTRAEDIHHLIERIETEFGRLDGLVSNAGEAAALKVEESSDEQWQADLDLKLMAAVRLARTCLPLLRKSEAGAIVNVLAFAAKAPSAASSPSSVSRAAGLALTKVLANELGPDGIRVNAVLPGLIASGQWDRRAETADVEVDEIYAAMLAKNPVPLGRFGLADEFADVVTWLLSPRASYVTGTAINVDGGLSPVS